MSKAASTLADLLADSVRQQISGNKSVRMISWFILNLDAFVDLLADKSIDTEKCPPICRPTNPTTFFVSADLSTGTFFCVRLIT